MAVSISGAEELRKKMRRFPAVAEAQIRQALEQNADELVKLAKSIVPVDDGVLQASIGWTYGDPPKGSFALATVKAPSGSRASNLLITVYAGNERAFYARWVEFGSRPHVNGGRFAGTQHPGTRATGFFFGSFRALRKRMKGRTQRAIRAAANAVAAGGGSGT